MALLLMMMMRRCGRLPDFADVVPRLADFADVVHRLALKAVDDPRL